MLAKYEVLRTCECANLLKNDTMDIESDKQIQAVEVVSHLISSQFQSFGVCYSECFNVL
jgi:hypothetical protein